MHVLDRFHGWLTLVAFVCALLFYFRDLPLLFLSLSHSHPYTYIDTYMCVRTYTLKNAHCSHFCLALYFSEIHVRVHVLHLQAFILTPKSIYIIRKFITAFHLSRYLIMLLFSFPFFFQPNALEPPLYCSWYITCIFVRAFYINQKFLWAVTDKVHAVVWNAIC